MLNILLTRAYNKSAKLREKFQRTGVVQCDSGTFLVVVLQREDQHCNATKLEDCKHKMKLYDLPRDNRLL